MANDGGDYKIGFGRPPAWGRFRPGRSGNPKGRPLGRKNIATLFRKVCNEKVKVKGPNGYEYVTKFEAAVTQLANKAASGDLKAIKELFRLEQSMPDVAGYRPHPIHIHFVEAENGKPKFPLIEGDASNAETDEVLIL